MPRMPNETTFNGRRAVSIENDQLRVTVLPGGGHIAEVHDKATGVNPLWTPPWTSIEPSQFDAARHRDYGDGVDAPLLAGIIRPQPLPRHLRRPVGRRGARRPAGARRGVVGRLRRAGRRQRPDARARLPLAGLEVERELELRGRAVWIRETVRNTGGADRPIGWTQHVTLGPPFLEKGRTEFRASMTRSRVFESAFGAHDYLTAGADFDWPNAPRIGGGSADLRRFSSAPASGAYTAHLTDPGRAHAFFVAFSPSSRLAFGYVWRRADFPWMGIWEENLSRSSAPWNSRTLTRGMEFGVSPFPETRREMVERGRLFDTPAFRWIPAGSEVSVEYWCVAGDAERIPETLEWPA